MNFRTLIKLIAILAVAGALIWGTIIFLYKPIYSVTLNGELVGYCAQKSKLQARIDDFVENEDVVYGITTGFGKFSDVSISKEESKKFIEMNQLEEEEQEHAYKITNLLFNDLVKNSYTFFVSDAVPRGV